MDNPNFRFGASHTGSIAALGLILIADGASGGSFGIREYSVESMGMAYSSAIAGAGDAGFALYNPAALSVVKRYELSNSLFLIAGDLNGDVIGVDQTVKPAVAAPVGAGVAAARVTDSLVLGIGLNSPFGLATDYENDFYGAEDGLYSDLLTFSLTPMFAWTATDRFSVGFGFSVIYNTARLTNGVGYDANGGVLEAKLNLDDITYAGSAGILWDVSDETRLGLSVRTGYDVKSSGILDAFDEAGDPVSLTGSAKISLPTIVAAGVRHELTPDWTLHAQVEWSDWSAFNEITVLMPTLGSNGNLSEATDYKDGVYTAIGAEYAWNEDLTLRAGLAYEPTPSTRFARSVRLPDSDRYVASIGASYAVDERSTFHAGYTAIMLHNTSATLKNGPAAGTEVRYRDGIVHLLGIGATMRF